MLALRRPPEPPANYTTQRGLWLLPSWERYLTLLSRDIALSNCVCGGKCLLWGMCASVCVLTHEHSTHADMYMCLVLCESLPALEIVPDTKILRQTPPESTPIPFSQEIHEEFG